MDLTVLICICLHIIFTPFALSQCKWDQEHKLDYKGNLHFYEDVNKGTEAVCLRCYRRFDNSFLRYYPNNGTVYRVYPNGTYYLLIKKPQVEDEYDEHNGTLIEENSTPKTLMTCLMDHPDDTSIVQQTTETLSAIFNYIIRYMHTRYKHTIYKILSELLLPMQVTIACLVLLSLLFIVHVIILIDLFIKANRINTNWLQGKKNDGLSDKQSIPQPYYARYINEFPPPRRAPVACLRQLVEQALSLSGEGYHGKKCEYISDSGLEGTLFGLLDAENDEKLVSDVQDTIVSLLQTLAITNPPRWIKLLKDVLSASTDVFYVECLMKIMSACEEEDIQCDLPKAKEIKKSTGNAVTDKDLDRLAAELPGQGWQPFMRELLPNEIISKIIENYKNDVHEQIFQCLKKWKQEIGVKANKDILRKALKEHDLNLTSQIVFRTD